MWWNTDVCQRFVRLTVGIVNIYIYIKQRQTKDSSRTEEVKKEMYQSWVESTVTCKGSKEYIIIYLKYVRVYAFYMNIIIK